MVMKLGKKFFVLVLVTLIVWIPIICGLMGGYSHLDESDKNESIAETVLTEPTEAPSVAVTVPLPQWETGYISALSPAVICCDEEGHPLETLQRGAQVEYALTTDGRFSIHLNGTTAYLQEEASVVADPADIIPVHTQYVRTAVNLRDIDGRLLATFADKGTAAEITGYDYLQEDGQAHMYRVTVSSEEGYVAPWYLTENETDALANYDGSYAIHADREDHYGGGGAANLDYYPRVKNPIPGNEMPSECRALYLASWSVEQVDAYLEIARDSGINAFVVDIIDGGAIGYGSDVMNRHCPTGAAAAHNTIEVYQEAIQKLKDAGYYVIGRIATFNDSFFVADHPECAISDLNGEPLKLSGEYWPSPFNRTVWQYKVDLAVEAVELMGFHEIQFDYVRFPDSTWRYESDGTIEFHNTYGETKAQAIQRFLMYATDILHEHGAYVSADVYGESAYTYVTAYGQYWPAISNVVDAISGMPYPDHFAVSGSWRPWEHPYDTLYNWGQSAMTRQSEIATPAVVRTWIQAYNATREPYTTYGPEEVSAQINGLRDAGCSGGYMTWNAAAAIDKYTWLLPAFTPQDGV